MELCWSRVFYFWSNTGMFPRPPWHYPCTMGGKQVSTATANLPALLAVHSLTTLYYKHSCHAAISSLDPSEYTPGKDKPTLYLTEQILFTGWNPERSQGEKLPGELRLLNQQLQRVAQIIQTFWKYTPYSYKMFVRYLKLLRHLVLPKSNSLVFLCLSLTCRYLTSCVYVKTKV